MHAQNNALVKYVSACASVFALNILKRVAEPTPIMEPMAKIRLYSGRTRFSAVIPSAPYAFDIKKVSARIYRDIPIIPIIFCDTYFANILLTDISYAPLSFFSRTLFLLLGSFKDSHAEI